MSYRNPRFFKEDYTLINRSFQTAFREGMKGALEYYSNIEKEQEEYESDVQVRSDLMKQDIAGLKGLQADTQAEILKSVNEFYSGATKVDFGGKKSAGFFAKNLNQERRSDVDLDLAAQNFSAAAQPLNALFQVLPELDEKGGLNKSSETYLEYAAVIKAARNGFQSKNPEIAKQFEFQNKGNNDFDMNIKIENPKWRNGDPPDKKYIDVDSKLLASYIGNNNPADLERYKEAYSGEKGVIKSIQGDFETRADEIFAEGKVPAKDVDGFAVTPEKYLKSSVDEYVNVVKTSAKGIPGGESMITDIFNNSVNFGYSKRYSMLTEASEDNPLLKTLVDLAEGDTGENGIFEKREIIADLLETKHNDTSLNVSLLKKLGLKGENVQTTIEALNNVKDNMVSEKIYLDLYAQGLTSKYRKADEIVEPDTPEVKKATADEKNRATGLNYGARVANEIGSFVGEMAIEKIEAGDDWEGPKVPSLVDSNYDYYDVEEGKYDDAVNKFKGTKVDTKDGVRFIDEVNYDPMSKQLTFGYDQKRGIKYQVQKEDGTYEDTYGDLPEKTDILDLSNPTDFEKLYVRRGVEVSKTGKDAQNYRNDAQVFVMEYAKTNLYRHLLDTGTEAGDVHKPTSDNPFGDQGSMHKYVSMVAKQDPKYFIRAMDNAATASKDLFNRLKDQYVEYGGRTMTVKALMVELETKNL
jgi:hypothetical protein